MKGTALLVTRDGELSLVQHGEWMRIEDSRARLVSRFLSPTYARKLLKGEVMLADADVEMVPA